MMDTTLNEILMEILHGSLGTVLNLAKVLIPLMIIIQLLMVYDVMEKIANKLEFLGRLMGMSKHAMLPLIVGYVMGVSYGAGTLLELNKTNPLSKRDMALLGTFMFLCHGIIETALLFGVNGASVITITLGRTLIALLVTMVFARTSIIKNMDNVVPISDTPLREEALKRLKEE